MAQEILLTSAGIKELEEELEHLKVVGRQEIKEKIQVPVSFAPAHVSRQRAGAVGSLAMKYYQQGEIQSARDHGPEYLRKSQAEREREERNAR